MSQQKTNLPEETEVIGHPGLSLVVFWISFSCGCLAMLAVFVSLIYRIAVGKW